MVADGFVKKFRLNAISNSYAQIVTVLIQLVLVPFYINYWGISRYADWVVLSGLPMILTILDFGVGQASANKAVMSSGGGNDKGVERSLQTAMVFTTVLACVLLASIFFVNGITDWPKWLGLTIITNEDAKFIGLFLGGHLAIYLFGSVLDGYFRSIDKTPIGVFLLANRRMFDFVITLIMLYLSSGPRELAAALFFSQVIFLIGMLYLVKKLSIYNIMSYNMASFLELKSIIKPALSYCCIPISQAISIQGGILLMSNFGDPRMLVGFSMARTLTRLILQVGSIVNSALKPEISRMVGAGNIEYAKYRVSKISKAVLLLCCGMYIAVSIAGPFIVGIWSSGEVSVSYILIPVVGVHVLLNVAWYVPSSVAIATNRHQNIALVYLVSSGIMLLLVLIFIGQISPLFGAVILLTFPEFCVALFYYRSALMRLFIRGHLWATRGDN